MFRVVTADGENSSRWPYRNFTRLPFNVNGGAGGSASLVLTSCAYGGKGEETNTEMFLLRGGVDCNHFAATSVFRDHEGHFGPENKFITTEDGTLILNGLFGHNFTRVFSNVGKYSNLRDGRLVENATKLPLKVNCGGGLTIILCSGIHSDKMVNAVYMVRSGFKDNKFKSKLLAGDDVFEFYVEAEFAHVKNIKESRYAVFHNRDNLEGAENHCFVSQTQAYNGKDANVLCEKVADNASFLVLCSSSNGTEDVTGAALYWLAVHDGKIVTAKELSRNVHKLVTDGDTWSFEIVNGRLLVTGLDGPNRYGLLSNQPASTTQLMASLQQSSCLLSGEKTKVSGYVTVTEKGFSGNVGRRSKVQIQLNDKTAIVVTEEKLKQEGDIWTFSHQWTKEELSVGCHVVRVFALRPHVHSEYISPLLRFVSKCIF